MSSRAWIGERAASLDFWRRIEPRKGRGVALAHSVANRVMRCFSMDRTPLVPADEIDQDRKSRVPGQSLLSPGVNLLCDHSDFEPAVGEVEHGVTHRAAALRDVVFHQLFAIQIARPGRQPEQLLLPILWVVGINPIPQRRTRIHEWIANGRHLRVEDGFDLRAILRFKDKVVVKRK